MNMLYIKYIGIALIICSLILKIGIKILTFKWRQQLIVSDLKIPKTKLVRETLKWCEANIGVTKNDYEFEIKYYSHKKLSGHYNPENHTITLYICKNTSFFDLINTIIHEYQHHLQLTTKKQVKRYDFFYNSVGYYLNPMEIEARKVADKYEMACIKYLCEKFNF